VQICTNIRSQLGISRVAIVQTLNMFTISLGKKGKWMLCKYIYWIFCHVVHYNHELDICIHQPTLNFDEVITLLQRTTFVVPWSLLNWNVQDNVFFFPQFCGLNFFAILGKKLAIFFLKFKLHKWNLQKTFDLFCSHDDPRPFLQVHELSYYLGTYKYFKNGLQTCINKLTIVVLINGLSKL
jgi:hypothetical protein